MTLRKVLNPTRWNGEARDRVSIVEVGLNPVYSDGPQIQIVKKAAYVNAATTANPRSTIRFRTANSGLFVLPPDHPMIPGTSLVRPSQPGESRAWK